MYGTGWHVGETEHHTQKEWNIWIACREKKIGNSTGREWDRKTAGMEGNAEKEKEIYRKGKCEKV